MDITWPLKLVYVEWDDADALSRWMHADELDDYVASDKPIHHAGFLLHEDDRVLLLTGQFVQADDFGDDKFGHVVRIPKPWIRKRIVLLTVDADGAVKVKR